MQECEKKKKEMSTTWNKEKKKLVMFLYEINCKRVLSLMNCGIVNV